MSARYYVPKGRLKEEEESNASKLYKNDESGILKKDNIKVNVEKALHHAHAAPAIGSSKAFESHRSSGRRPGTRLTFLNVRSMNTLQKTTEQDEEDIDFYYLANRKKMKGKCLFEVDGKFMTFWNIINSIIIIYVAIVLPVKFSFFEVDYPVWDTIDRCFDVVFLFDIIFTFFKPYYQETELVVEYKKIACNYISGKWFWIDIVSIFPFDVLLEHENNYTVLLRISKVPQFYKLLKISRLIKSFQEKKRGNSFLAKLKKILTEKDNIIQLIPIFLFIFLCCHCVACFWHYFAWHDTDRETWISRTSFRDEDVFDRYIASLYFVFQTITTVGYGDIGVGTRIEFGWAIILMFTGVLFYSNILSELLDMIEQRLLKAEKIQQKHYLLRLLQKELSLPINLVRQMKRTIANNEEETDDGTFRPNFDGVIKKDSEQLLYEVYSDKFEDLNLFKDKNKSFLIDFAMSMKEKKFKKNSLIYEVNDFSTYFYVIRSGIVDFCLPEDRNIPLMECREGYFGEIEIMKDEKRKYTAVAKTDCHLYLLPKAEFFNLFQNRDREFARRFNIAWKERENKFKEAYQTARNIFARLLDEIRAELSKDNPFYKFQQAVRSEKFRRMYLSDKTKQTKKEREQLLEENKRFLMQQRDYKRSRRKKTVFMTLDANGNVMKPDEGKKVDNEERGGSYGTGSTGDGYQDVRVNSGSNKSSKNKIVPIAEEDDNVNQSGWVFDDDKQKKSIMSPAKKMKGSRGFSNRDKKKNSTKMKMKKSVIAKKSKSQWALNVD